MRRHACGVVIALIAVLFPVGQALAVAPTVISVSLAPPAINGTYGVGGVVPIRVTFGQPVTVTGTPQLTLETGATDRIVNYSSGSGTTDLLFNYTVQSGDTSADLDYASTTALGLNSGTIANAGAENATLTLPATGGPGSLAGSNAIVLDTAAPTLASATPADGASGVLSDANIVLNFSEPVVNYVSVRLRERTGTTATITTNSIHGLAVGDSIVVAQVDVALDGTWVVASVPTTTTFTYTTVSSGTIASALAGGAVFPRKLISIIADSDTQKTITNYELASNVAILTSANHGYVVGDIVNVSLVPEPVFNGSFVITGATANTFSFAKTAANVASTANDAGRVLRAFEAILLPDARVTNSSVTQITINPTATLGDTIGYHIRIDSGAIRDTSSNVYAGINSATVLNFASVATAPKVRNVNTSTANGSLNTGTVPIRVYFDSPVTVSGTPTLLLPVATPARAINYASGSTTNVLTFNYAIQAGDNSADLDYASSAALSLNGGTIGGSAAPAVLALPVPGTTNSLGANHALVIDTTNPFLTGRLPSPGAIGVGLNANLSVRFDGAVTGTANKFVHIVPATASPKTITNSVLSSNVATLASDNHGYTVGSLIDVVDMPNTVYNGSFTVTAVNTDANPDTFSYAKVNADIASASTSSQGRSTVAAGTAATATWAGGTATITATSHGFSTNQTVAITGMTPSTYNGVYVVTVTNANVFTYALAADPGGAGTGGKATRTFESIAANDAKITILNELVTINPAGTFTLGLTYYVLIEAGGTFKDLATNDFGGITSNSFWTFTTGTDVTAPDELVAFSDPPNLMPNFTVDRNIYLMMTEPISAVSGTFIKLCTGDAACGSPVETFTATDTNKVTITGPVVDINPTSNLGYSLTYFLLIDSGAFIDGAGNQYTGLTAGQYTFTTTVAPQAGSSGPVPVNTIPGSPIINMPMPGVHQPVQFFPPPSYGAGGVPIAGSLTGGNMGALPPSAFNNFNSGQIRQISGDALAAFRPDQLAALPPSAMAGFNQNQMANLPPSAMAGFNQNQMAALPPEAMAGFNQNQMAALPPSAMAGFNRNQMANLAPTAMAGFNASQMANLPPSAMAGFNQNQMAALPPGAMAGMQQDQFRSLPPSAMAGFNPNQMAALPPDAMSGMRSTQMRSLPPEAMSGMKMDQVAAMPPSAMAGFNANQMANLPPTAMAGFNPNQMAALPPSAMSGMQMNQFAAIPPTALEGMNSTQLKSLPADAMAGMHMNQFSALPPSALAGVKANQFAALPPIALSGMQANQFAALPPATLGTMSAQQMDAVPASVLGAIKPSQFKAMSPELLASMSQEQRSALPPEAFNTAQIQGVGTKPIGQISGSLNGWNVSQVPAASFAGFKPTEVAKLSDEVFSSLSADQFRAMPPTAFSGMKADQVGAVPPDVFAVMKPAQFGSMPANAFGSFNAEQVSAMPASVFAAMKPSQMGQMPPEAMANFSSQQMISMPPNAFAGFKPDHISALPPTAFSGMKPSQMSQMPPAAFGSFSPEQMGALPPAAFAAMKPSQMGQMPPEAMANFSSQQMTSMPPNAFAGFKPDHISALPPTAFSGMKPSQMSQMPPAAFGSFSPEQMGALPPAAFAAMKPSQMGQMPPEAMANFSSQQMTSMPPTAFAGFKPDQISALPPEAMAGMKPAQFGSLSATAFGAIKADQVELLPPNAFAAMKPTQMSAMPPDAMSSLNSKQVGVMPPTTMAKLKADQVDALPPAAFAEMKPAQVGALTPTAVSSLSAQQVGTLPANALSQIKPSQVAAIQPEAMAELKPTQVTALPPTAVAALKPTQISELPPECVGAMKTTQLSALKPAAATGFTVEQLDTLTAKQEKSLTAGFKSKLDDEQRAALANN